jgi:hydrogenase nickel incorporation protein HypA/HybF
LHEYGIAQSIIAYALSQAERSHAERVSEIQVDVGELTMVDVGILSSAFRDLAKGTPLQSCKLRIRKAATSFDCRRCRSHWSMEEAANQLDRIPDELRVREPDSREFPVHFLPGLYPSYLRCPRCGSADVEAIGGDGIRIRKLVTA